MPRGVVCSGGHERDNDAVTTRSVRGSQNVLDDGHRSRGSTLAHFDRERDDDDDGRSGSDGAADSPYSSLHSGHVEGDACSAGTLYGTRRTLPCSVSAQRRES